MITVPAEGEPGARKNVNTKDGENYGVTNPDRTLCDFFDQGLSLSADDNFLGTSDGTAYNWITYKEADEIRKQIGSALRHRGIEKGGTVGISSQNTAEWTLLGLGCDIQSILLVPLYDTLGEGGVKYILNQTNLPVLFAHPKTINNYISYLPETQSIKLLVRLPGSEELSDLEQTRQRDRAADHDVELLSWEEFLREGKKNPFPPNLPAPDDLCTLCYTSGTTGFPKGAMLTHKNLVATTVSVMEQLEKDVMTKDDIHMSYLPASHVFERLVQTSMIVSGGAIGYWQGDVKKLATDMQALRPTVFPAVPRILNRLYDKVQSEVSGSALKSMIFNMALNSKVKGLSGGTVARNTFWDAIVFKKIQNMLGGRIRLMATGAAPLKPTILQFFRAALGATVYEGYGQTENCGACTITCYRDHSVGHVGAVTNACIIKLVDVPDMGYYAKDNKGEVCIKGIIVMKGYYKNEEKTREAIDEDGWLHTGDIGQWTESYALKIIDRKKNIFKLSQGEYIAPEKIELIYDRVPLVGQVLVHGSSFKSSIVAIIVPDELTATSWCEHKGIKGTFEELCRSDVLKTEILNQITENAKAGGLKGFEIVKDIYLTPEPFGVENDQTTPTFKLKRQNIMKAYQEEVDKLYENLE